MAQEATRKSTTISRAGSNHTVRIQFSHRSGLTVSPPICVEALERSNSHSLDFYPLCIFLDSSPRVRSLGRSLSSHNVRQQLGVVLSPCA